MASPEIHPTEHRLDLNLLIVFQAILRTRSVSRAADTLGLTQPAVSNALARLRQRLDDPLFTRGPQGMAPTPRAQALAGPLQQALALIDGALQPELGFEPATSRRAFTLGMTDIGEIYFLPALVAALAEHAPGVTLRSVRCDAQRLREGLSDGSIDLAIGLLPQLQTGFHARRLFLQRYVCLFRRGHALHRGAARHDEAPVSAEGFAAAEHVRIVAEGTGHGQVDALLAASGAARQVRLTVPHFVAVGHILRHSDLVATVPQKLAEALSVPFDLCSAPAPVALPRFEVGVFWHTRLHRDPANRWLRRLLAQRFTEA